MRMPKFVMRLFCLSWRALFLFAAMEIQSMVAQGVERVRLRGRVIDDDNKPIQSATVLIYSARPKEGASALCPTCYPDCQKQTKTDVEGNFEIPSLDPALRFKVLVLKAGFESHFVDKVDPALRKLSLPLATVDPDDLKDERRILGQAIGPDGKPAAGAIVNVEGVAMEDGRQNFGDVRRNLDPLGICDDEGHFLIRVRGKFEEAIARVSGRDLAPQWIRLHPGKDQLVRMKRGVSVRGRLLAQGQPLAKVVLGLTSENRGMGENFEGLETASEDDGTFRFSNIPANLKFQLFAKMAAMGDRGSVSARVVVTTADGTTVDVGEIIAGQGFHVSGRVVLSDSDELPRGSRMYFSRENVSDYREITLGPDGKFDLTGVPPESVSIGLRLNGYKISKKNESLDWLNGQILGKVSGDITDLNLLLEPGEWRYNEEEKDIPPGRERYPRDLPLRGAKVD